MSGPALTVLSDSSTPMGANLSVLSHVSPTTGAKAAWRATRRLRIGKFVGKDPAFRPQIMKNLIDGATFDIWTITIALAIAMPFAWFVGRMMGRRLLHSGDLKASKFDDASTALLGLLLAFSFGVSFAKYDQRKLAVVADSNAIGDFYTSASLLKEPFRSRLQGTVRQYVQLRIETSSGPLRSVDLEKALTRFDRLHSEMTEIVYQALSEGTPIAVSLTNTLNGVTSNQASRLAAYRDRLPGVVVFLLFTCSIIAAFLIG